MNYYRIVFAKNEILYCDDVIDQVLKDLPTFKESNGQVIFALVKAENIDDATKLALAMKNNILGAHQQPL